MEKEIQNDLDSGMFYTICSNETTFKKYVFNKIKKEKENLLKEMKKECDKTENEGGRILIEKFK